MRHGARARRLGHVESQCVPHARRAPRRAGAPPCPAASRTGAGGRRRDRPGRGAPRRSPTSWPGEPSRPWPDYVAVVDAATLVPPDRLAERGIRPRRGGALRARPACSTTSARGPPRRADQPVPTRRLGAWPRPELAELRSGATGAARLAGFASGVTFGHPPAPNGAASPRSSDAPPHDEVEDPSGHRHRRQPALRRIGHDRRRRADGCRRTCTSTSRSPSSTSTTGTDSRPYVMIAEAPGSWATSASTAPPPGSSPPATR